MVSQRLTYVGLPRPDVNLAPKKLDVFLRAPHVGPIGSALCLGLEGGAGPGPEWPEIGHGASHFLIAGAPGPQDQASGKVKKGAERTRWHRRRQERNFGAGQVGAGIAGGGPRSVKDTGDGGAVADYVQRVIVHVDEGGRG